MKGQGVTQQQLADYIGCSRQSISLYIEGKRNPDIEVLKKISDFFQISADYLLGIELYDETKEHQTELMLKARPLAIGICKRLDESLIKTEQALQFSSHRTELFNTRMDLYEWLFCSISKMISDYDDLIEKLNGTFTINFEPVLFSFDEVIQEYQALTTDTQENNNKLLSLLCRYRDGYTQQ